MQPLYLFVRGMRPWKTDPPTQITFLGAKPIVLAGEGRVDKASIQRALAYALPGETPCGDRGLRTLMNEEAPRMRVSLVFWAHGSAWEVSRRRVRLFFVEEFSPYSWAFLPRGCVSQVLLSGGQQPSQRVPASFRRPAEPRNGTEHRRSVPLGRAPFWTFARRSGTVPWEGRQTCDGCDEYIRRAANRRPLHRSPEPRAPCAAADAVFADAKAFLSSNEARQMSESELERELHRRRQDLVRKLLQGHRDQRSPKEAAGPAEDTSGVECSEPHEHESHAETTSGTMQVVGLGCARRGHDGLHRLDAALNLLPERYLVEMRRRVTIATASRAPPRTPWKPQWYSTSSTWQRRRGVRCSSSAHRRACRHLVRDPMGVDRRTVTLGCSCGGSQPPQAAGVLMRTETSHEAREDQRKSPIGR